METVRHRSRHGLAIVGAVLVLGFAGEAGTSAGIAIVARTAEERAVTEWALTRYAEAGLQLPPVVVAFHADASGCRGNSGYYRSGRIDLCVADQTDAYVRRTLVHELAHAWCDVNLGDGERADFLRVRGLHTWNARSSVWAGRGFEQSAEVITWGVGARETRILLPDHDDPESLGFAYELLTGMSPME